MGGEGGLLERSFHSTLICDVARTECQDAVMCVPVIRHPAIGLGGSRSLRRHLRAAAGERAETTHLIGPIFLANDRKWPTSKNTFLETLSGLQSAKGRHMRTLTG